MNLFNRRKKGPDSDDSTTIHQLQSDLERLAHIREQENASWDMMRRHLNLRHCDLIAQNTELKVQMAYRDQSITQLRSDLAAVQRDYESLRDEKS